MKHASDTLAAHDMQREFTRHLAEHEIMLSFVNDVGAEMFTDWWNSEGVYEFEAWVKENKEEYGR